MAVDKVGDGLEQPEPEHRIRFSLKPDDRIRFFPEADTRIRFGAPRADSRICFGLKMDHRIRIGFPVAEDRIHFGLTADSRIRFCSAADGRIRFGLAADNRIRFGLPPATQGIERGKGIVEGPGEHGRRLGAHTRVGVVEQNGELRQDGRPFDGTRRVAGSVQALHRHQGVTAHLHRTPLVGGHPNQRRQQAARDRPAPTDVLVQSGEGLQGLLLGGDDRGRQQRRRVTGLRVRRPQFAPGLRAEVAFVGHDPTEARPPHPGQPWPVLPRTRPPAPRSPNRQQRRAAQDRPTPTDALAQNGEG
ncbi:hypothetical protein, partial [Nocardiopsis protaetiae]